MTLHLLLASSFIRASSNNHFLLEPLYCFPSIPYLKFYSRSTWSCIILIFVLISWVFNINPVLINKIDYCSPIWSYSLLFKILLWWCIFCLEYLPSPPTYFSNFSHFRHLLRSVHNPNYVHISLTGFSLLFHTLGSGKSGKQGCEARRSCLKTIVGVFRISRIMYS